MPRRLLILSEPLAFVKHFFLLFQKKFFNSARPAVRCILSSHHRFCQHLFCCFFTKFLLCRSAGLTQERKKRNPKSRILFSLAELTEKEGFEPSRRFNTTYTLSRGASSASWVFLRIFWISLCQYEIVRHCRTHELLYQLCVRLSRGFAVLFIKPHAPRLLRLSCALPPPPAPPFSFLYIYHKEWVPDIRPLPLPFRSYFYQRECRHS